MLNFPISHNAIWPQRYTLANFVIIRLPDASACFFFFFFNSTPHQCWSTKHNLTHNRFCAIKFTIKISSRIWWRLLRCGNWPVDFLFDSACGDHRYADILFYDKPFNTCWEISVHILLMMRKTNKHQRSLHLFGFILWGISERSNRSFINQKVSGFIPGFPSSACRSTLGEDTHLSPGVVRKYLEGSNCVGKIYLWPIYIWTDRNLHP